MIRASRARSRRVVRARPNRVGMRAASFSKTPPGPAWVIRATKVARKAIISTPARAAAVPHPRQWGSRVKRRARRSSPAMVVARLREDTRM